MLFLPLMISVQTPPSVAEISSQDSLTVKGIAPGRKLFGRYTAERILGRGGMGVVWLARDERLDRNVAIKVLPDEVYHDPAARDDLRRETRKSLELTHPNIVRIHDFIEDDNTAAISMEYVDGSTLTQLRLQNENRTLDAQTLGPWVGQICHALDHAHTLAKLAHRDLKPANVMVNARGSVKITDFGIACSLRDSLSYVSLRHNSSGTLAYMSPQQMMGEAPSPLDDIYSLGAMLFELLTSKPPFHSGDIAQQVLEANPSRICDRLKSLDKQRSPIPPSWEKTIARCLSKEPHERPRSALEVGWLLGLAGFPQPASSPILRKANRTPGNTRTWAIAGCIILAAGLGASFALPLRKVSDSNSGHEILRAHLPPPVITNQATSPSATEPASLQHDVGDVEVPPNPEEPAVAAASPHPPPRWRVKTQTRNPPTHLTSVPISGSRGTRKSRR